MHVAAETGAIDYVEMLIEQIRKHADWEELLQMRTTLHGNTAFHLAAINHPSLVPLFLEADADTAIRNDNGETVFHALCHYINASSDTEDFSLALRSLLESKKGMALLTEQDRHGQSLVHVAVLQLHYRGLVRLLDSLIGCDALLKHDILNAVNSIGQTALHSAAQKGDYMKVALLLRAGANKDMLNFKGETAENLAEQQKHFSIVTLLRQGRDSKSPRLDFW